MITLIARREVSSRLQQKSFRIGLLVTLVLIAVVAVLPRFLAGHETTSKIGVSGANSQQLSDAVTAVAGAAHEKISVHVDSAGAVEAKVKSGDWDAGLADGRIYTRSSTSTAAELLQAAYRSVSTAQRLTASGLDVAKVNAAMNVPAAPVVTTQNDTGKRRGIATITVIALFAQLISFVSWVAMGVVEEKTSRVIELILSTVRPWQLLTGKLIGIGVLALGQLLAMAAVGLGVATAVGSVSLPPGTLSAVVISVGWFVLSFAFFSALAAALASLVSRQEEVSGVLSPVTAVLMVTYLLGFAAAGAPDGTISRVASLIPPLSGIAMPARLINGGVPASDVLIAVLLMIGGTVLMVALASKIFRAAVLHTGSKLKLADAWRGEAVASLD